MSGPRESDDSESQESQASANRRRALLAGGALPITRRVEFGDWPFGLRGASQLDDWEMRAISEAFHDELEISATHGATAWHPWSRLEAPPRR